MKNYAMLEKWIKLTVAIDPLQKWYVYERSGGIVFTTDRQLYEGHKMSKKITNFIAQVDPHNDKT